MIQKRTVTLICQSKAEVRILLQQRKGEPGDRWIAANPAVGWELKKQGIPYQWLDDFEPPGLESMSESLLCEQLKWAGAVDAELQKRIPHWEKSGFRPVRYALYHLKNTWDTMLYRMLVLSNIPAPIKTGQLIYFADGQVTVDENLSFQNSALSAVIPLWASHFDVSTLRLERQREDSLWTFHDVVPAGFRRLLYRWCGKRMYTRIRTEWAERGRVWKGMGVSLTAKLVIKPGYDFNDDVLVSLGKNHGLLPWGRLHGEIRRRAEAAMPANREALEFRRQAEIWCSHPLPKGPLDWDWTPALRPVLEVLFRSMIPRLWVESLVSEEVFRRDQPGLLAAGVVFGITDLAMILAARRLGIPCAMIQHGGAMGEVENPVWDLLDRFLADTQLVWGEGEKDYLASRPTHGERIPSVLCVGSPRLEMTERRMTGNRIRAVRERFLRKNPKPLILYVPGAFFSNFFRFTHAGFRDGWIFDIRRRIMALFCQREDVQLIYKEFMAQGEDPSRDMIRNTCPSALIVSAPSLPELMSSVDAVIHENPGTGFLEGLSIGCPTLVYADQRSWKFRPESRALLSPACRLFETGDDFIKGVEDFLDNKGWLGQARRRSELGELFTGGRGKGAASELVAESLSRLCQSPSTILKRSS